MSNATVSFVIKSFRHKGLAELYNRGKTKKIGADLLKRVQRRLNAIRDARTLEDLSVPGFDFHPLRGEPKRYRIHVNGPWCIVFEWTAMGEAVRVDLVQYH